MPTYINHKITRQLKRLVFLASGSGTNFQSVIDKIHTKDVEVSISGLITNNPECGAIKRAKQVDIPTAILTPASFPTRSKYEDALLQKLESWNPDLIVLAGYLLKIPTSVIQKYPDRIINIHPSLLPKFGGKNFYGLKVHQAVLEAGELETGCSVHIVVEEYDKGPLLAQRNVPVYGGDSPELLSRRVLEQEHELLPEVILDYLSKEHSKKSDQ